MCKPSDGTSFLNTSITTKPSISSLCVVASFSDSLNSATLLSRVLRRLFSFMHRCIRSSREMSGSMTRGLVPLPLPLPLPDKEEDAADEACSWKKLPTSFPNEERASKPLLRSGPEVRVLPGLLPLLPLPLLLRLRSKEAAVVAAVVLGLELEELVLVLDVLADADMDKGSSVAATGCLGGALMVGWARREATGPRLRFGV